jgi:hypothetical protein
MRLRLHRTQRQWLVLILCISLLLPISLATLLAFIGKAAGCQMVGETADLCQVAGLNLGQSIKFLVDWTWAFPTLSLVQVPFVGIAVLIGLLILIHKSFQGWSRALIGFLCVWYLGFGPPTVGILFVAYFASQGQCSINEGGVGACYLFGLDMGTTFHTAASLPWLIFILLPVCGLTSLIYAGIALANLNQRPQSSHPK